MDGLHRCGAFGEREWFERVVDLGGAEGDRQPSEGGVKLVWEQCSSEQFAVYKVVRSATNPNPLYPLNDGTELIAAMSPPTALSLTWGLEAYVAALVEGAADG